MRLPLFYAFVWCFQIARGDFDLFNVPKVTEGPFASLLLPLIVPNISNTDPLTKVPEQNSSDLAIPHLNEGTTIPNQGPDQETNSTESTVNTPENSEESSKTDSEPNSLDPALSSLENEQDTPKEVSESNVTNSNINSSDKPGDQVDAIDSQSNDSTINSLDGEKDQANTVSKPNSSILSIGSLDEQEGQAKKDFEINPVDSLAYPTDDEGDLTNKGSGKSPPGPMVVSKCGTYQGSYKGAGIGIKYEQFLGIPYALPPVGPLRFKRALANKVCNANKLIQATQFCSPCMQPLKKALETSKMEPSEDCLCLNIYRPTKLNKHDRKPVLVYIYESYFLYGSAAQTELNGGVLAHLGDMIVVTVNHRLGALGWLYGGVDEINGNMGDSDVLEAVKWVNDHIEAFGGDANKITIGGHGSGATIAMAFMFDYNLPSDLFQGVMIMSPDLNPQSFVDPSYISLLKSNELLKLVDCSEGSKTNDFSEKEVQCLNKVPGKILADSSEKIPFADGNGICSRSQLLTRYRRISIDDRLHRGIFFRDKNVFIGSVNTEFKRSLVGASVKNDEEAVQTIVNNIQPIILDQRWINLKAIVDYYVGTVHNQDLFGLGQRTALALNMVCFTCPVDELVDYLSRYNKVYAYQYTYVASCDKDSPKRIYGAYHGDDVLFGFGEPLRALKKYSDYDREVSKTVIGIWSDFVHQRKMKWPNFDYKDRFIGLIQGAESYYISSPYTDICELLDA